MQAGVFVAMLHRLRQREQNRFGFFQRIDQRFVAQHRPDAGPDHGRLQRLDQKFVRARFDSRDLVLGALDAGGHQDRNQLSPPVVFQQAAEIRTAHLRHHQIHHHQIHFFAFQNRDRPRRTLGLQDPVIGGLQHRLQQTAIQIDVVDNQHRRRLRRLFQHAFPTRDVHVRPENDHFLGRTSFSVRRHEFLKSPSAES